MGELKEVRFDIYCKKCIHKNLKEEDDPCWDCLKESVNVYSKKPVNFKEDPNAKNSDSSTNV